MEVRRSLFFLAALILCLDLPGVFCSAGTTFETRDYWILTDGYDEEFTPSGRIELSYGYWDGITEKVFYLKYNGSSGPVQKYGPSGNLLQYGFDWGSEGYFVVSSSPAQLFPPLMESGKTYHASWQRKEYDYYGSYLGMGSDYVTIAVTGPEDIAVPAGTFTVFKIRLDDLWTNSSGETGTSVSRYWVAKDVGWVQFEREGITYKLLHPPLRPPLIETGSVSALTRTSATLNGRTNPRGASTSVWFEYGTTSSYGNSTTPVNIGDGDGWVDTGAPVSGLIPDTDYHFRMVAESGGGRSQGRDRTFSTAIVYVEPEGQCGGRTPCYATIEGAMERTAPSTSMRTIRIEGGYYEEDIVSGTEEILALQGGWNSDFSAQTSCSSAKSLSILKGEVRVENLSMAPPARPPVPTATTGSATSVTSGGATLNGTVNPGGATTTVVFEYGTDTGYGSEISAVESPLSGVTDKAVKADVSGLVPGATYHFRVKATNTAGTAFGSDAIFSTDVNAPVVTTGAATSVTSGGATLNGTVNPGGATTTVVFEYGTDTGYGSEISAVESPLSGVTDKAVKADVSGLEPGATYHFRVKATNTAGTAFGSDAIFSTDVNAPVVTTGAATSVTSGGATLNGTVNPGGATTTVVFEYGTDTGYGSEISAVESPLSGSTDKAVSADVSGLVPGATYHFRVKATNAAGTGFGSDASFSTDVKAPAVTTGAATSVTSSGATLNGTVNPGGVSTTVVFEYGADANYGSEVTAAESPVSGTADQAVSADLTGLIPGTAYHFRVKGSNASGTVTGGDSSFTTDTAAPVVATGQADSVTWDSATLTGTVNPGGAATTYYFEYGRTTGYGSTTEGSDAGSGTESVAVSASVGDLSCDTAYHFRLVAANTSGTVQGEDGSFTTEACNSERLACTGQTNCYNDTTQIPCPEAGSDFYGQDATYTINVASFTKLDSAGNVLPATAASWSMVRDNVTGLIWEVKTDDNTIHDKDDAYAWQDSGGSFIASLNSSLFGGYSDWRVPTLKELASIVDYGRQDPAVETYFFPQALSSGYWSSTLYDPDTDKAWGIDFMYGYVFNMEKTAPYHVRAVRGGLE